MIYLILFLLGFVNLAFGGDHVLHLDSHKYNFADQTFNSTSDEMVAFWKLGEASGTRFDWTLNNHDLADNATVLQGTGHLGNGADFEEDNTEFLNVSDNADLSTGDIDYTIIVWATVESKTDADSHVASKWLAAGDQREWALLWDFSDDEYDFRAVSGTDSDIGRVSGGDTPTIGAFDFVVAGHNMTANQVFISINGAAEVTASTSGVPIDGTGDFFIGILQTVQPFDGIIDAMGFFRRKLSTADITYLYNSGTGRQPPF